MLDLLRTHSQAFAHLPLLYPSLGLNVWSIPVSYSHFSSPVCEIPTSLSSLAQSGQRAKPLFTCPGFEAFFPSTSSFIWSDPANSRSLRC